MKKILLSLAVIAFLAIAQNLPAQGTAFTYQGQLQSSSGPANGNYDLTFALFTTNTVAAGQEVGGVLTNLDVGVTNGLFTTTLDFGPVFTGNATWLAVGVRTNGGGNFALLSPLQALTPTPYAIYAPTAGAAASADAVAGSNIVGSIAAAALPTSVVTNATPLLSGTNTYVANYYATNGIYPFTVPAGVFQMVVKLWGAGAEGSQYTHGGGGAFSQVTLEVTPGDSYVAVVGQSGGNGGGAGANNGSGGASATPGGTGGQASSLFQFTGTAYIMKAVAGGGGGGGNGFGGNAGQTGGSGVGYAATATTTGVASLNLIGGDGVAGESNFNEGGGGGGGYGGGTINPDGQANGGGSYGDVTAGGSYNLPGNTSDPNYLAGSAIGGNFPYGGGGDGLAFVIFTQRIDVPSPGITLVMPVKAPSLSTGNAIVGGTTTNVIAPLTVAPNVPVSPIGSVNYSSINSLAVAGRYVYAYGGSGFQIYDVSAPSTPAVVGFLNDNNNSGQNSVAVAGRYAYLANGGLQVIDVGNPASPALVGSVGSAGATSVAVAGRYAYVANSASNLLQIIDVSKPAAPVIIAQAATISTANGVAVVGHYAYVSEGNIAYTGALQVFDVGLPALPVAVGSLSLYYGAGLAVSGDYAYVGAGNDFTIINVTNAALPKSVATTTTPGYYQNSIAVAGRYAFVGGQNNGSVYIYDVSTPASPVLAGSLGVSGVNAVAVSGRYLYAGNGSGLTVFDLGGAYVQSLEAGTLEAGTLQTRDAATIGNNLSVRGGLNTGGNALIAGGLSISGNGIAAPNYALFVNGTVAGTSAYVNASDERYKTNITGLDHALDKVMALRGVTYDWRRNVYPQMNFDDGRQIGFLAQEVKQVLPEAVSQDANGYYGIAYSKVIPLLVEAIKDQQKEMTDKDAEIEALKAKSTTVDALEKQNDSLTQRLNELAAAVNALASKK